MSAATLPKAFWPGTIVAGQNDRLDITVGGVAYAATVAPGTFYSVTDLGAAVVAALNAAIAAAWQFTVDGQGRVTISQGSAFGMLLGSGANVARSIGPALGFLGVDRGASPAQIGDSQHANGWYAADPVADDTLDLPVYQRSQAIAISGHQDARDFGERFERTVSLGFVPAYKSYISLEDSAHPGEALQRLIRDGWQRFRWWPDASVDTVWADYQLHLDTAKALARKRVSPGLALYGFTLKMLRYVDQVGGAWQTIGYSPVAPIFLGDFMPARSWVTREVALTTGTPQPFPTPTPGRLSGMIQNNGPNPIFVGPSASSCLFQLAANGVGIVALDLVAGSGGVVYGYAVTANQAAGQTPSVATVLVETIQ